ncbi:MAG: gluconolactonase [Pirellulaceae bacterium]|jgi:gluconolactonase
MKYLMLLTLLATVNSIFAVHFYDVQLCAGQLYADELYTAKAVTEKDGFTPGIEGPACDAAGNIYAVNWKVQHTIGRTTPDGKSEIFVTLPNGSVGNGIRFDRAGQMYVADYVNHNVLQIDPATRKITVFAHEDKMNQPNDIAIGPDGTLYASDPNWGNGTGNLWRVGTDGKVTQLAKDMGTTNGIEVSPDGKTLYVNESKQLKVWAFDIVGKKIENKRLLREFPDHGFDGMRCDVDGNLYISRYGKGVVVKLSPDGKILREIGVLGAKPSNVCFGGPDGKTVYVTEVENRRLVSFRVESPGLSWQCWQDSSARQSKAASPQAKFTPQLFAFQNGVHFGSTAERIKVLKELGYDGIGSANFGDLANRVKQYEAAGMKLYSVYTGINATPDFNVPDPLANAIKELKGSDTVIELFVNCNGKDDIAAAAVRQVAELAKAAGLQIVLYPHTGCYVDTLSDAVRVAKAVDRDNVGVMFNLCHFLKVEPKSDLSAEIGKSMDLLRRVSISGAENGGNGWGQLIQPLDRGSFKQAELLKLLRDKGYQGVIGLQCYGIRDDSRQHLERSAKAWKTILAEVNR